MICSFLSLCVIIFIITQKLEWLWEYRHKITILFYSSTFEANWKTLVFTSIVNTFTSGKFNIAFAVEEVFNMLFCVWIGCGITNQTTSCWNSFSDCIKNTIASVMLVYWISCLFITVNIVGSSSFGRIRKKDSL